MNFATGANHVNLPQLSDKQCSQCHVPTTGNEFDASVKGAHTVATRSTQLAGVNFAITGVDQYEAGTEAHRHLYWSRTKRAICSIRRSSIP